MRLITKKTGSELTLIGRIVRKCVYAYLFFRISTLGFTLLLPLLGAASSQQSLPEKSVFVMLTVGIAFHIFAYVLNDIIDLQVDRSEPLRADSPLVQGKIDPRKALRLVLLQPPLAFAIAYFAGATSSALTMLGIAFLALAVYDIYGKRCPVPLFTDVIQAVGWCTLLLFGTFLYKPVLHHDTLWLLTCVFVYVLLINGIHGGVRDLANDHTHQARTTAIWLGARSTSESQIKLPIKLIAYGFLLQAAMVTCAIFCLNSINYPIHEFWVAAVPVLTGLAISTIMLMGVLLRLSVRRKLVAFGATHTFISMAVLPALYLPVLSPATVVTVIAVFALPTLAMYLYNGSRWCL